MGEIARDWRRRVLALVGAMLLAGCGARVGPEAMVAAGTSSSQVTVAPEVTVTAAPGLVGGGPAAAQPPSLDSQAGPAPQGPPPMPAPGADFGPKHNNGTLRITLSASCVVHGTPMTATLEGPPKGGVGVIVGYSDYQSHGAMAAGESDVAGRFVLRWVVAPTAPLGDAIVLGVTTGPNGEQDGGGTADARFRLVRHMGECS